MRKLILASLTISAALSLKYSLSVAAQTPATQTPVGRTTPLRGSLERRLTTLLDQPPFNRASWAVVVTDGRGRVVFNRNSDRYAVPASNTKLVVTAAAAVLLPADYRVTTSLYLNGAVESGILQGDLVLYGRGDPTFSTRCYSVDTLALGACDSSMTAFRTLADSVRAHGIRRITGKVVGDGSYFEPMLVHPDWGGWDLNWWYAAPVSGLGFNDNSIDFRITPGDSADRPPLISWYPDFGVFTFENRARTVPADSGSTIGDNFYRVPGTWDIWAEGTVALGSGLHVESFAVPDPNRFAARALAIALMQRGIAIEGGTASTTDSLAYRHARSGPALAEYRGRPLADILFPILNVSQNTFAEALLKILGREFRGVGSWAAGLDVERRFLIDSVGLDSTAFGLADGSGLSASNLVSPAAFVRLLDYMHRHPKAGPFLAALPRSTQPGSLRRRFVGTPLEGQVAAKTGSIARVNTLSGYIERPDGKRFTFSIQANAHSVPGREILAQIDSIVVEIGKPK
ncbi:MAG: D-alanyl-D-alanine carboxypeptidase/D-alanyl-D-alanine-endopeptidase [Gemmatimonadetes bacterium]|nr:D-alanyl-D-alanine carboxypeptidase/D-alanyl-D-alanine-endopeptidase [Gemmatimonadota bacterium]